MYIRQNDGRYAGEIRDFPSHIALEMIRAGRAVNPFDQVEERPEQRIAAQQPAAPKPERPPRRSR